jgi:hypothetical protein
VATLRKRARAKYISGPLAIALAELRSPLEKSYRNTVYCARTIAQTNGELECGPYCGNRWCLTCNRIRTGRAMNRYLPVTDQWADPRLVTLTVPNCTGVDLPAVIGTMLRRVRVAVDNMRRRDRLPFVALRKLECTHNAATDTYHPHFHFLVEGGAAARALVDRWLRANPDAVRAAQDDRAADPATIREVFKYFTKLTTKGGAISLPALDLIFRAMRRRRVYQPMGFTPAGEDEDAALGAEAMPAVKRPGDVVYWHWDQERGDWLAGDTGEPLSGYEPTERYRRLVATFAARPPTAGLPP